jgi:hypothetical protein
LHSLADLLAFGLAEQRGSGNGCEVRISELGWRAIGDPSEEIRLQAWAEAASRPKLIADQAARWGYPRPADHLCIPELVKEYGFTEERAARFLKVFDNAPFFIGPYKPEITLEEKSQPPCPVVDHTHPGAPANAASLSEHNQLNVYQRGNRLQITADVDLAGLAELQQILDQYRDQLWP